MCGLFASFALSSAVLAEAPDVVARRYDFVGEVLIARGNELLLDKGYGPIAPSGGAQHVAGERWRLASITKQIAAALILRGGESALDAQVPGLRPAISLRALLTHHSGLPNPDSTPPGDGGVPIFYARPIPDLKFCTASPPQPGAAFSYNNCDYLVAAGGRTFSWPAGMAMARKNEIGIPGFVGGRPEPSFQLASWGAAGGLLGTARALWSFDRSLMSGTLLSPTARAALWQPEGGGSAQATGQWVFTAALHGCAAPKRIVQRDGEIYGVQARNFLLPDDDLVVILFTNRSSDDFKLGEVWEQKGFVYDLISAAACKSG